jgi:hypothetical protein
LLANVPAKRSPPPTRNIWHTPTGNRLINTGSVHPKVNTQKKREHWCAYMKGFETTNKELYDSKLVFLHKVERLIASVKSW